MRLAAAVAAAAAAAAPAAALPLQVRIAEGMIREAVGEAIAGAGPLVAAPAAPRPLGLPPQPTQDPREWDSLNALLHGVTLVIPAIKQIPLNNISFNITSPLPLGVVTITDSWLKLTELSIGNAHIGDFSVPSSEKPTSIDFSAITSNLTMQLKVKVEALLFIPKLGMDPPEHVWGQDLTVNISLSENTEYALSRAGALAPADGAQQERCNFTIGVSLGCIEDPKNHSEDGLCDIINNVAGSAIDGIIDKLNGPTGTLCNTTSNLTAGLMTKLLKAEALLLGWADVTPPPVPSPEASELVYRDYIREGGDSLVPLNTGVLPVMTGLVDSLLGKVTKKGVLEIDSLVDAISGILDDGPPGSIGLPAHLTLPLWNVPFLSDVLRLNVSLTHASIGGLDSFTELELLDVVSDYSAAMSVALDRLSITLDFDIAMGPGSLVHGGRTVTDAVSITYELRNLTFDARVMLAMTETALRKATVYGLTRKPAACLAGALLAAPAGIELSELLPRVRDAEWNVTGNVSAGLRHSLRDVGAALAKVYRQPLLRAIPQLSQSFIRPALNLLLKGFIKKEHAAGTCPVPATPPPAVPGASTISALAAPERAALRAALARPRSAGPAVAAGAGVPPGWGPVNDALRGLQMVVPKVDIPALTLNLTVTGEPITIRVHYLNLSQITLGGVSVGDAVLSDTGVEGNNDTRRVTFKVSGLLVSFSTALVADAVVGGVDFAGSADRLSADAGVSATIAMDFTRGKGDVAACAKDPAQCVVPTGVTLSSCDMAIDKLDLECTPTSEKLCGIVNLAGALVRPALQNVLTKACADGGLLPNITSKVSSVLPLASYLLHSWATHTDIIDRPNASVAEAPLRALPGGAGSLVNLVTPLTEELSAFSAFLLPILQMKLPSGILNASVGLTVPLWNIPLISDVLRANVTLRNISISDIGDISTLEPVKFLPGGNFTFETLFEAKDIGFDAWVEVTLGAGSLISNASSKVAPKPVTSLVHVHHKMSGVRFGVNLTVGIDKERVGLLTLYGLSQHSLLCAVQPFVLKVSGGTTLSITSGLHFSSVDLALGAAEYHEEGFLSGGVDALINGANAAANDVLLAPLRAALPYAAQTLLRPVLNDAVAAVIGLAQLDEELSGNCLLRLIPEATPQPPAPPETQPPTNPAAAAAPRVAAAAAAAAAAMAAAL